MSQLEDLQPPLRACAARESAGLFAARRIEMRVTGSRVFTLPSLFLSVYVFACVDAVVAASERYRNVRVVRA